MGVAVGRKVQSDPQRARYNDDLLDHSPVPDRGPFFVVRDHNSDGDPVFRETFVCSTIDAHYGGGLAQRGTRTGIGTIENGILKVRRLTPLECERIMGFPDQWTAGCSDSQRYKQLGNSLCPHVVELIATRIYGGLTPVARGTMMVTSKVER
jgi:hypothetical protein